MGLLEAVRVRALQRPWLLAPPVFGLVLQRALGELPSGPAGAVALKAALTALTTAGVTAIFAELWLGDGRGVSPGRLAGTVAAFLIPYPLLLAFGGVTAPLVYWALRADIPQAAALGTLYLVLALGKLAAFFAGAVSAVASARREEAGSVLASLRLGARTVGANTRFFLGALAAVWLIQEACVIVSRAVAPALLTDFLTTLIPLFGCIAVPIEAWRSGRLFRP